VTILFSQGVIPLLKKVNKYHFTAEKRNIDHSEMFLKKQNIISVIYQVDIEKTHAICTFSKSMSDGGRNHDVKCTLMP
jgi:hypothetical protein